MRRVTVMCGIAAIAQLSPVSAVAAEPASADLGVTVTGTPRRVRSGDLVDYAVRLVNRGPAAAAEVSVSARLSPGLAIVTVGGADCAEIGSLVSCGPLNLAPGRAAVVRIQGIVKPSASGAVKVTARADTAMADPVAADNIASVTTPVGPSTDLDVRLAAPRSARPGGLLYLVAAVHNRGPRPARVALHLGARRSTYVVSKGARCRRTGEGAGRQFIRCGLGLVAPGQRRAVRLTVRVDRTARASAETFAATVSADMGDSRPGNNVAMARVRFG